MVLDVGDEPRLGSVMKLTGNFFIVSFIEIVAEGGTCPACMLCTARHPSHSADQLLIHNKTAG